MYTYDDLLELLKVTQATLDEMLSEIGWTGRTEFGAAEGDALERIYKDHEDNGCSYLRGHLWIVAETAGLDGEQFALIEAAITQSGGLLSDYLERFPEICQQVSTGTTPEDAVLPPKKEPIDSVPELLAVEPIQVPKGSLLTPDMLAMIYRQADTAATETLSQVQGIADHAGAMHKQLKEAFVDRYLQQISLKMNDPEFEANFTVRMMGGFDDGKKPLITGATTPAALPSSDS